MRTKIAFIVEVLTAIGWMPVTRLSGIAARYDSREEARKVRDDYRQRGQQAKVVESVTKKLNSVDRP